MLNTMGIIFANNEEIRMGELTRARSLSAMPVAGRYRLIDFGLSSMVNSGISNIGVTTKYNFQSLMDHLGGGLEWDLVRKKYGLFILPPFFKSDNILNKSDDSVVSTLHGILHYIKRSKQDYCLLADGNVVINTTFDGMLDFHKMNNADITIMYSQDVKGFSFGEDVCYDIDKDGQVKEISLNCHEKANKNVGFYLIDSDLLITLIEGCYARGESDFFKDLISKNISKLKIMGYECKDYCRQIYDIKSFYDFNMELLNRDVQNKLFDAETKIFTKVKDMVPTRYLENAKVKNSFIADGCIIDGEVNNSILFRAVEVRKGAKIENCIVMQNGKILENATLDSIILDKNVVISSGKTLISDISYPIVVGKNRVL